MGKISAVIFLGNLRVERGLDSAGDDLGEAADGAVDILWCDREVQHLLPRILKKCFFRRIPVLECGGIFILEKALFHCGEGLHDDGLRIDDGGDADGDNGNAQCVAVDCRSFVTDATTRRKTGIGDLEGSTQAAGGCGGKGVDDDNGFGTDFFCYGPGELRCLNAGIAQHIGDEQRGGDKAFGMSEHIGAKQMPCGEHVFDNGFSQRIGGDFRVPDAADQHRITAF